MSNTYLAVAPNGATVRVHAGRGGASDFVYAFGHRIYGVRRYQDATCTFLPYGKWAFILAPNVAAVQPETAEAVA